MENVLYLHIFHNTKTFNSNDFEEGSVRATSAIILFDNPHDAFPKETYQTGFRIF